MIIFVNKKTIQYASFTLYLGMQAIHTALILLAAGNSSRLGRPKQLLPAGHSHLMGRMMEESGKVPFRQKVLVLGAYSSQLITNLYSNDFQLVINNQWHQGMATSIRAGLEHVLKDPSIDQVMILLCDQPFVDASLLLRLLACSRKSTKGIIASTYADTLGVPVVFKKPYFSYMLKMQGQGGAKQLIGRHRDDVDTVAFPNGHIDIDTEEDYDAYTKNDLGHFLNKKEL